MTLTVIVPTGETRQVKVGEWVQHYGIWQYVQNVGSKFYQDDVFPIGIAYAIEVPEKADNFVCYFIGSEMKGYKTIHLPRPKKKVKKWQWCLPGLGGGRAFTTDLLTQEELLEEYGQRDWYHKIDETMEPVEE